jgi:uncharacterized protein YcaQ
MEDGREVRTIDLELARRLAVEKQHLGGERADSSDDVIVSVVRDLAYVQMDPVSILAPSHLLSLWSRLEGFRESDLDRLLWREKRLLTVRSVPAAIIPAEDYALHRSLMKGFPDDRPRPWWVGRRMQARQWLTRHEELRESLLRQLEGDQLTLDRFEEHVRVGRRADGWTPGSDVALGLAYLEMFGEVMVVGRSGNQNVWGLPEDFLPEGVAREELPLPEVTRLCAERAVRALGTASPSEIYYYFPRARYLDPGATLQELERAGRIARLRVTGLREKEPRYIHVEDLPLLEKLRAGTRKSRMAFIAPFDNLIAGRSRTQRIFGFDFVHGNYLPAARRKFGVHPMPILWGDELIGRLDAGSDRPRRTLRIGSIHAEPKAPRDRAIGARIDREVRRLAKFLDAAEVEYGPKVPAFWKPGLG